MKTILLKFSGPLQSWGSSSHYEHRHTNDHPSKSAVIGMVAAALGYRRDEDEMIGKLNDLQFAARIDQAGEVAVDFQIAAKTGLKKKDNRTYVTYRDYLQDSVIIVALGHQDDVWISQIEEALRKPYFQLFMGRRSCPVPADFIIGSVDEDPLTALTGLPWQAASRYQRKLENSSRLFIYGDADLVNGDISGLAKDHVISFSSRDRRFSSRREFRIIYKVERQGQSTEHDAFSAIGG